LFTPCHTTGHICYYVTSNNENVTPCVFTGDTLFISGCGRFFEGTAEQMYNALIKILSTLPKATVKFLVNFVKTRNLVQPKQAEIK
jgi:hydroxyacylglutathione hydrolase